MFCPYPGTIKYGHILLVGVIGKYEYRPYVRRIGHNEQIEFHCDKGYKMVGPPAATCVDGQWSPDNKPYCAPGQHPRMLYIFRGKRSINETDSDDQHNEINILSTKDKYLDNDSPGNDVISQVDGGWLYLVLFLE